MCWINVIGLIIANQIFWFLIHIQFFMVSCRDWWPWHCCSEKNEVNVLKIITRRKIYSNFQHWC